MFQGDLTGKLFTLQIDEDKIAKKLLALREDKAAEADSVSPQILLEVKEEIIVPLTQIF